MFKFGNHARTTDADPLKEYRDPMSTFTERKTQVVGRVHSLSKAKEKSTVVADMMNSGAGSSGAGGFGPTSSGSYNNSGVSGYNHDQYNVVWDRLDEGSVIEGWIPRDAVGLDALYRRIVLRDPTLGPGIDLLKNLPWSDYNLEGIDDPAIKRIYEDTMESLHVPLLMPEITGDYLTIGKNVVSLAFDERKGIFSGVLPHDPDFIKITPIPIYGYDPLCDLKLTPGFIKLLNSDDPRMVDARKTLPPAFVQAAKAENGFMPLDPNSTIYLPRTGSQFDYVGTSILTRALYFWGIEKALLNSQLISVRRRARSLTHVKAGIENVWEPLQEEMDAIIAMFMQANEDPTGAVVGTRNGVEVSEPLGAGQDFYKWSDELELFAKYKMQVLGLSDALLSGDATYSNSESARTVFVELLANLRFRITQRFFYMKLFPTLARLHGFVKRSEAELTHNIRVNSPVQASLPSWAQAHNLVTANRLSARDRMSTPTNQLIMPRIDWHKQLRPSQDMDALNLLEQLQGTGYPVTLSKWASAAGYTTETLEDELKEDRKLRALIKKYEDVTDDMDGGGDEGSEGESLGDDNDFSDFNAADEEPIQQSLSKVTGSVTSPGQIGIWKFNRCNSLKRSEVERVIASVGQGYDTALFKDPKAVVSVLREKFKGNEEKVFATIYVLNRMGLTNIRIPVNQASKLVNAAHLALANCKSVNSTKFLTALSTFEKEMKCLHKYAGGKINTAGIGKKILEEKGNALPLGTKELSGLF